MIESSTTLKSIFLGNERTVWVRRPAGGVAPQHLVIFLDAEIYRGKVDAIATLDRMAAVGAIPPALVVFVSSESEAARWKECPCHPPFAKFVAHELLPWLVRTYPTIRHCQHRVLIGLSYTGLAATYLALHSPDAVTKVVAQSGSFWWHDGWLAGQFAKLKSPLPVSFYLEVGIRETAANIRHRPDVLQVIPQVTGVRQLRDVLRRSGHRVLYSEFDGSHEYLKWKETLPAALIWALTESPTPSA